MFGKSLPANVLLCFWLIAFIVIYSRKNPVQSRWFDKMLLDSPPVNLSIYIWGMPVWVILMKLVLPKDFIFAQAVLLFLWGPWTRLMWHREKKEPMRNHLLRFAVCSLAVFLSFALLHIIVGGVHSI